MLRLLAALALRLIRSIVLPTHVRCPLMWTCDEITMDRTLIETTMIVVSNIVVSIIVVSISVLSFEVSNQKCANSCGTILFVFSRITTEQRTTEMVPTTLKRKCQSKLAIDQALGDMDDSGGYVFDPESDIKNMQATHRQSLF